jgi:hypothetical protein
MMPRAVRLAVFALVVNALLGIALLFDHELPGNAIAVIVIGFVALDVIALASLATISARRKLPAWTVLGFTAWFIGILAGAYTAAWIATVFTSQDMPSWSPGSTWFYVETIGRVVGQASIVVALAAVLRSRAQWLLAAVWAGLALVAFMFELKLLGSNDLDEVVFARYGREIAYSAELLVLAWLVVKGERELRDRDLAPARVIR